jgi:hypothetical protein
MSVKYPGLLVFNVDHLKKYVPLPPEMGEWTVLPEMRTRKSKGGI